uniref:Large ribosomal subunit protein bL20c n=1 Tax=Rhizanthella gardneri TaxID=112168 RepID=E7BKV1_RHIGD|nr:ribosomal protein L20 [Rhizanthella gardneri]ACU46593.1 ribosomal protein L20 [Rhizanthella gardneri]
MVRVKRGYTARKRLRINSTRTTIQQRMRALVSFHRDSNRKKIDFRCLWITRINAATCDVKVFHSYNIFIHNLYKNQLILNRKILMQIALSNNNYFDTICNKIMNPK